MDVIFKKNKGSIKLMVDLDLYPLSTIYSASYVFLDRATIYLDKETHNKVAIWIFPKNKKDSLSEIGKDFCNELINYVHYFDSLKVNADIIKVLMQKALFSAAPSLLKEAGKKEIEDLVEELQNKEKSQNKS
ncbi:MAG: hypothetical protein WC546_04360 [Candidatus Omnitrophota bacterium]